MNNALLALGKLQTSKKLLGLKNRQIAQLVNVHFLRLALLVQISQRHRQNLRLQTRPVTIRARALHHILFNFLPNKIGIRFLITPLQVGNHTLPRRIDKFLPVVVINILKRQTLLASAIQNQLHLLLRQFAQRSVQRKAILLGQRLNKAEPPAGKIFAPMGQRALPQAQLVADHQQPGVHLHPKAQARTARASAIRIVK